LVWAIQPGALSHAKAQQIFLSAPSPFNRELQGWNQNDYSALFTRYNKWPNVAALLEGFEFSTEFVIHGDRTLLQSAISSLTARRIKITLSGLMLIPHDNCGSKVEGYTGPDDLRNAARTIKSMGGTLAYVAMDEPLWFGHTYSGVNACQTPLDELARAVSAQVAAVRSIFPDVKIIDTEPVGTTLGSAWIEQVRDWLNEYERQTNDPLTAVVADPNWGHPEWRRELSELAELLQSTGVPLGIIYDGIGEPKSDREWTEAAMARANVVERQLAIRPQYVFIASWTQWPERLLPEDDPTTLTGLVQNYLKIRASAKR
jgi:hypothetical protein